MKSWKIIPVISLTLTLVGCMSYGPAIEPSEPLSTEKTTHATATKSEEHTQTTPATKALSPDFSDARVEKEGIEVHSYFGNNGEIYEEFTFPLHDGRDLLCIEHRNGQRITMSCDWESISNI